MSIEIVAMPFEHDAAECIEDILENIAKIEGYLTGLTREMFENDDRTRDAAERCLERICEAVFRLGARAEQLMPGQPSSAIRGMGNRLRHAYDNIDLPLVWGTIQDDLPTLKADAERALAVLRTGASGTDGTTKD
jgi:uncharacterized protein with HEPN domain